MSKQSTATKNYAPPIIPTAPWRARRVLVLPDYCLEVEFLDGTSGTVFMKNRVSNPRAGVFKALKDPELFRKAHLEYGVVTWPGEVDLAPDVMYEAIKRDGVWILK